MFKIGMKVVCVRETTLRDDATIGRPEPKVNDVLVVNRILEARNSIYLGFEEMHPRSLFVHYNFRPVQNQYTEEEIEAVNIDELTKEKQLIQT